MTQRNAILFFAWLIAAFACLIVRADSPSEHPPEPSLNLACLWHAGITKDVWDDTCVLVKRERITRGSSNGMFDDVAASSMSVGNERQPIPDYRIRRAR
jgi:hypothetical protein